MQDFAILDGFRNRLLFRLNSMFFVILYDKGSPRQETLLFKSDQQIAAVAEIFVDKIRLRAGFFKKPVQKVRLSLLIAAAVDAEPAESVRIRHGKKQKKLPAGSPAVLAVQG